MTLIDFTLSNARRFYSSIMNGEPLASDDGFPVHLGPRWSAFALWSAISCISTQAHVGHVVSA